MKMIVTACLSLLLFLVAPAEAGAQAQSARLEIPGIGYAGRDDFRETSAFFTLGLTLDEGATFTDTARASDTVRIMGTITPEPAHIGQRVDIFVVVRINDEFMMKNTAGNFLAWNGRVPDLVPFRESVVLEENHAVDVYTGMPGTPGERRVFIGYRPGDGLLRFNPNALRLNVTQPPG